MQSNPKENRQYPRVLLRPPADLWIGDREFKETVNNVSTGGFQIRCTRDAAAIIHPDAAAIGDGNHPEYRFGVQFPFPGGLPRIEVVCSLRYREQFSDDEFGFGAMFVEFIANGQAELQRFLNEAMRPPDAIYGGKPPED